MGGELASCDTLAIPQGLLRALDNAPAALGISQARDDEHVTVRAQFSQAPDPVLQQQCAHGHTSQVSHTGVCASFPSCQSPACDPGGVQW